MSLKDLQKKVFVSVFFSFLCTCEDEGVPPDSRFQTCNPPNFLFAAFAVAGSGALQNFFENLIGNEETAKIIAEYAKNI